VTGLDLAPIAIGFFVGALVGATSTGGGALLTPALVLVARVPPSIAIGSDVLIAAGMKLVGGGFYALRREVHWQTAARLAAGSLPGAAVGIAILNRLPVDRLEAWLAHALGFVLILAAAALFLRVLLAERLQPRRMPSAAATVGLGFVTGVLVSMTSVGSGSLLLCVLVLGYPLAARTSVGTDLVHALVLSSAATVGHAAAGRVDVALAGAVLVGGIPGVLAGARLATAVPERPLRASLAVVLFVLGVQLAVFGVAQQAPASTYGGEAS